MTTDFQMPPLRAPYAMHIVAKCYLVKVSGIFKLVLLILHKPTVTLMKLREQKYITECILGVLELNEKLFKMHKKEHVIKLFLAIHI